MTQLLLSYLAAGCKGAGLWSWNARLAGWEGGEFALLDRNEQVCERTIRSGSIAKAANKWRDELWQAVREPQVGILTDFDNEAIWAAMGVGGRTKFKYRGVEAVSARSCFIDASLTLEHVTGRDLEAGLASRYPILFLPSIIGLKQSHIPLLKEYVEQGGRLVLDMPGGVMMIAVRSCSPKQARHLNSYLAVNCKMCNTAGIMSYGRSTVWNSLATPPILNQPLLRYLPPTIADYPQ